MLNKSYGHSTILNINQSKQRSHFNSISNIFAISRLHLTSCETGTNMILYAVFAMIVDF